MDLTGIHHLTAVSARIRDNHHYYTQTLGMRLVKRSVNQDDVSAYHLFYADAKGSPGTDLTFFDWPVPRERRGTHSINRVHLRVAGLEYWQDRLGGYTEERDGREVLDFEDPEGQRLTLLHDDTGPSNPWNKSPVPAEHQVRGLGPIQLSVPDLKPTDALLTKALNMRHVREYGNVHVYEMGPGGPAAELHVAVEPNSPPANPGAGGVHHVAFRTPTFEQHQAWIDRLTSLRVANSGLVDRFWFRSLYFREPNGILFEIASDGPGFTADEDESTLGEKVVLPPHLEAYRNEIVPKLKPID